jgi:MHS family proline/betaine transporter-like MFS transporter
MHENLGSDLKERHANLRYRRSIFAAVLGNGIEYYDNALYGLLAVYLSKAFFSSSDPAFALLATYATFIISYAVRPIAGLALGRLADLYGHRSVLVLTINLMTVGTAGIGLLPTYGSIGIWSPVLLVVFRALQGIGASAEFTVATSYALEQSPPNRRHTAVGWSVSATSFGPLLASLAALTLTSAYGGDFFASGAWRVPFLLSAPIGLLAFYLRKQVIDDGLLNSTSIADKKRLAVPLFQALRGHWSTVGQVIALGAGHRVGTFCIQTYFMTALMQKGYAGTLAMLASVLICSIATPANILGGMLADKVGGRIILIVGFALYSALALPLFYILGDSITISLIGITLFSFISNFIGAALNFCFIMPFPRSVRGAASALNFNIGTVLFGATAPLIATFLISYTGSEFVFGCYVSFLCAVSCLTATLFYPAENNPAEYVHDRA